MASAADIAALEARMAGMLEQQHQLWETAARQQQAAFAEEARVASTAMAAEVAELRGIAERQQSEGRGPLSQNAERQATIARGTTVLGEREREVAELQARLHQLQAAGLQAAAPLLGERDAQLAGLQAQLQATVLAQQAEAAAREAA